MLSYLSIGANDPRASALFYEAVLLPLGYGRDDSGEAVRFSLPDVVDRDNGPGTVWVQRPFDGRPATPGNGMMPAFQAPDADMVKRLHAAGLAAGGVTVMISMSAIFVIPPATSCRSSAFSADGQFGKYCAARE
jgi:hypothetical protein